MGITYKPNSDKIVTEVSNYITKPTEIRELLIDNVYVPNNTDDRINQINRGITLCYDSDILLKSKNIDIDKTKIAMANELRKKIIKVDEYNEKFH